MNQIIYREFKICRCYDKNNMKWDNKFFIDGYNGTYESTEAAKNMCDYFIKQDMIKGANK